jgi:hypothetical protein
MTTYERPVEAKLVVRLANGEEWEATADDLAKFGYAERYASHYRFRLALIRILESAGLTPDAISPIRYLSEVATGTPELLDHDDFAATRAETVAIETLLRRAGVGRGVTAADVLRGAES